jgi:hypothetical protein
MEASANSRKISKKGDVLGPCQMVANLRQYPSKFNV